MSFGLCLLKETVVDNKIQRCREIRHVTAESVIRVDGDGKAIEIQTVVGSEERLHIGVFVALHLTGWETTRRKTLIGSIALGIHHIGRMLAYHLTTLLIEVYILLL